MHQFRFPMSLKFNDMDWMFPGVYLFLWGFPHDYNIVLFMIISFVVVFFTLVMLVAMYTFHLHFICIFFIFLCHARCLSSLTSQQSFLLYWHFSFFLSISFISALFHITSCFLMIQDMVCTCLYMSCRCVIKSFI